MDWSVTLHSLLGVPPTSGNRVRVLRNGAEIFPAMLEAISGAQHTVDLVTFVYWTGDIAERFADALCAAARRGCRVRVLLDAIGARHIDGDVLHSLVASGADVRWFRPVANGGTASIGEVNHRTHRKVLVCDGSVGFTGGVGIAAEWSGNARDEHEWRDTHVAVRGPAVAGLQAAFLDNWADTSPADHVDGEGADDEPSEPTFDARDERPVVVEEAGDSECMVVRGAAETGASDLRRLLLALIQLAETRLRLVSAYFNPDDGIVAALIGARERGVEVQLLLPGRHHDKRFVQMSSEARFQRLLDCGIDLRTYERTMLHAKIVTVDGAVATIGSANLNDRSMQHDEECNLIVFDPAVVTVLDDHFDDDVRYAEVLDPARWADRSGLQKLGEKVTEVADRWL